MRYPRSALVGKPSWRAVWSYRSEAARSARSALRTCSTSTSPAPNDAAIAVGLCGSTFSGLPSDVLADVEEPEARQAENVFFNRLASNGQDDDKLAPYHNKTGGSSAEPPAYSDD